MKALDLLGHEVLVIAFVDQLRRGGGFDNRALDAAATLVADVSSLAREHCPVAVLEISDGVRKWRKRDRIRSKIHFTFAVPDSEWRSFARADQQVVVSSEEERQGERATQLFERSRDRIGGRLAVLDLQRDQMRDGLSVGFTDEFAALFRQLLAQLAKIVEDAVVNDRDDVGRMRMSIVFCGTAMRGPACVTDPDIAPQRLTVEPCFKRTQFAFGATTAEYAVVERGDTRGVIAAVLETFQGVDQLLRNRLGSQNSDNPAHPFGWPLCPSFMV